MTLAVLSLQNPDIVLVHYLNVPAIEDCGKPCGPILCSINTDKKEWAKWTKEELIGQLKPMCEYLGLDLLLCCVFRAHPVKESFVHPTQLAPARTFCPI